MTQIMERTNELLFQMILYISVIWILSNCQQLYESECNSQHDSFYRVCKVNALETTIQRSEKQNKELLLRLSDREQKNLKSIAAYRDILKLYGSQIVPNGMYVVGFFLYNIIVLLITHCLKCIWYHLLGIFLNNKNWDSQKDFLLHLSMIKEKRCSIHCVILFPQWKIIKLQIHWNYYTMYNWFTFDLLLFCHFIIHCQTSIAEICLQHTELVIGSSTDCHRYYNCSEQSRFVHKKWPTPYLHECVYPFMFSEETLKCENYSEVFCGKRFEATWECKLFMNPCHFSWKINYSPKIITLILIYLTFLFYILNKFLVYI